MPENEIQDVPKVETPAVEPGAKIETPIIDTKTEIEKVTAALEAKYKAEIAGLNRKNNEYQKELNQKELEGKTVEEQNALLLKEQENILSDIAELNRGEIVKAELYSVGLPLEFAKHIMSDDLENIKEDVKFVNDYIDKLVQERADKVINERLGGVAPVAGNNPVQAGIDEQIKTAQQAGDFTRVLALKAQKSKQ